MSVFAKNDVKLAWEKLREDDQRLPKDLREAIAEHMATRKTIEDTLNRIKAPPKGRRWMFSWKFGVSVALADASTKGTTSYFS